MLHRPVPRPATAGLLVLRALALLAALLLPGAASVRAAESDFVEESGLVPVRIGAATLRLEMLFVRKGGATERLPVALISHGKPSSAAEMAAVHATNYRAVARDFASRGWLAVVVVRRGYGLSEGLFQSAGTCQSGHDLMRQFRAEADDLEGALAAVAQRRDADSGRILAVGVSDGAVASLALAARRPRGLKAVINISGGLRNEKCPFEDKLVAAFRELGAQPSPPSLWLYAENDSYFPPATAARLEAAYALGQSPASLVMIPPIAQDGHRLFSAIDGRIRWWPEVDRFLRARDLPTWPAGRVDEVMRAQKLDSRHRQTVERYLSAPGEKALVKGGNGAMVYWLAGADSAEAAARKAIASCIEKKAQPCQLLLANQDPAPAGLASDASGGKP